VKSCCSVERFVKVEPKRELPLIHDFLRKTVRIKVDDDLVVEGLLVCYQMQNKTEHKPSVLVLKNGDGFYVLRGNFENVTEVQKL
jgi:small nuclear ribonucleoprotein (snRNP)-like protein